MAFYFAAGAIFGPALILVFLIWLVILTRKVKHMSAAQDGFTAAVAKLQTDVNTLIAENGPAAVQAAVDAQATADTAAVAAVDATVVASLKPPA